MKVLVSTKIFVRIYIGLSPIMNSSAKSTFERQHVLWSSPTSMAMALIGPILAFTSSTICLLILNTFLKMLHPTLKSLLNIISINNISNQIFTIILLIYVLLEHSQTFMICSLFQLSLTASAFLTLYGIAIMSFLRFHITWKVANNESTHQIEKYTKHFFLFCGIFEYFNLGLLSFFITLYFDAPTAASNCAGANIKGIPILPMYHFIRVLVALLIGIYFDGKLIKFLKKRNATKEPGQAKLVPWKSGGQVYDFLVPTSATISSSLTAIVGIIMTAWFVNGHLNQDQEMWKLTVFAQAIGTSVQMSVMIGLTFRAAKNRETAPQIPRGPMYHEDDKPSDQSGSTNGDIPLQEIN